MVTWTNAIISAFLAHGLFFLLFVSVYPANDFSHKIKFTFLGSILHAYDVTIANNTPDDFAIEATLSNKLVLLSSFKSRQSLLSINKPEVSPEFSNNLDLDSIRFVGERIVLEEDSHNEQFSPPATLLDMRLRKN